VLSSISLRREYSITVNCNRPQKRLIKYNRIKQIPGVYGDQMPHLDPYLSSGRVTGGDLGCPTSNGVDSGVLANESVMAR